MTEIVPLSLSRRIVLTWLRERNRVPIECKDEVGRDLAAFLGLKIPKQRSGVMFSETLINRALAANPPDDAEKRLVKNVEALSAFLDLTPEESRILLFLTIKTLGSEIRRFFSPIATTNREFIRIMAICLDLTHTATYTLVGPTSRLTTSGILGDSTFGYRISEESLAWDLLDENFDVNSLTRFFGLLVPESHLQRADFQHISPTLDLLIPYLKNAMSEKRCAVNVLIYGPPGTGKTELSRLLGKEIGCSAYECAFADIIGDPLESGRRISMLRSLTSLLSGTHNIVICDEMDELFDGNGEKRNKTKLWFNRLLESNAVPIVWLANSLDSIHPAILRRFDFIFELPVPPKENRMKIIRQATRGQLSESMVETIAASEEISPAIVDRMATVIRHISVDMDQDQTDSAFHRLVSNSMEVRSITCPPREYKVNRIAFDPEVSCSTADLHELLAGIRAQPEGRLCLHGPPGTGKTEFGRWLAESLDKQLHVHRMSDLLAKYVGETEKLIARAFKKAREENAVLLFDEVDSLLASRENAVRSWEVTQVNEMLTCMEEYRGICVATTNRIDALDTASRRRFDLMVGFNYMAAEQIEKFFRRHIEILGLLEIHCTSNVLAIPNATPGDFAALARRNRFSKFTTSGAFAIALIDWCAAKPDGTPGKVIGFRAS